MTPRRILLTGAGGVIGSILHESLRSRYEVVAVDRRRARGIRRANLARIRPTNPLFSGVDAVVDLAAVGDMSISWRRARENMRITENVLRAAREHGVGRYVFASSNHVTGRYERDEPYASIAAGRYDGLAPGGFDLIGAATPPRPDSPYAVAKLFGEAAARFHSDAHGMSVICLRIGTVRHEDVPSRPRHFATLLSHGDLRQLVDCALAAPPELRFGVYYGVSDNTWRFWAIEDARTELGYAPRDDAERHRS